MPSSSALCNTSYVRRFVLVVYLALLTFDLSGLAAICAETSCDEICPTDVSGGQCPPNCHYCSCCSLPKVMNTVAIVLVEPHGRDTDWVAATEDLASLEPAEILHVPKLPVA